MNKRKITTLQTSFSEQEEIHDIADFLQCTRVQSIAEGFRKLVIVVVPRSSGCP